MTKRTPVSHVLSIRGTLLTNNIRCSSVFTHTTFNAIPKIDGLCFPKKHFWLEATKLKQPLSTRTICFAETVNLSLQNAPTGLDFEKYLANFASVQFQKTNSGQEMHTLNVTITCHRPVTVSGSQWPITMVDAAAPLHNHHAQLWRRLITISEVWKPWRHIAFMVSGPEGAPWHR